MRRRRNRPREEGRSKKRRTTRPFRLGAAALDEVPNRKQGHEREQQRAARGARRGHRDHRRADDHAGGIGRDCIARVRNCCIEGFRQLGEQSHDGELTCTDAEVRRRPAPEGRA